MRRLSNGKAKILMLGDNISGHLTRAVAHLLAKAAAGDEVDQGIEQGVAGEGLDQQAPVHVCLSKVHRSVANDCAMSEVSACKLGAIVHMQTSTAPG